MSKIALYAIAMTFILGVFSCKTNEKNYRQAYETATTKKDNAVDDNTMTKIKAEENGSKVQINGESVNLKNEFVQYIEVKPEDVKKFGIVVGQFKQIFNAKSFRNKLVEKGYPSYVLQSNDSKFYVIAKGFDKPEEAADYIKNIKKNIPFTIPIENPWILSPIR